MIKEKYINQLQRLIDDENIKYFSLEITKKLYLLNNYSLNLVGDIRQYRDNNLESGINPIGERIINELNKLNKELIELEKLIST